MLKLVLFELLVLFRLTSHVTVRTTTTATTPADEPPLTRRCDGMNTTDGRELWEISVLLVLSNRAGEANFDRLKRVLYEELSNCFHADAKDAACVRLWFGQPSERPPLMTTSSQLAAYLDSLHYSDGAVNASAVEPDDGGVTTELIWAALTWMSPDFHRRLPFLGLVSDFVSLRFVKDVANDTLFVSLVQSLAYSLDVIDADAEAYYRSLLASQNIHPIASYVDFHAYHDLCRPAPNNTTGETTVAFFREPAFIALLSVVLLIGSLSLIGSITCCYLKNKWTWKREVLRIVQKNHGVALDLNATDGWEIRRCNLCIRQTEILGTGAFGTVYKGLLSGIAPLNLIDPSATRKYEDCEIAVKMLPSYAELLGAKEFQREISIMKSIGFHENLVNLLGCISVTSPKCLVMEYCEYGDLLHFVRQRKHNFQAAVAENNDEDVTDKLSETDLISFAWQISNGMSYLHGKGIVHRDLAARNILVSEGNVVKLADFGLSRQICDDSIYTSMSGRLPVKWMAIESLKDYVFTPKSDVWSYGVTLWEVFSLGLTPFPLIDPADMVERLTDGLRLMKPDTASPEMYDIMTSCWRILPEERPTFVDLGTKLSILLENILKTNHGYIEFCREDASSITTSSSRSF